MFHHLLRVPGEMVASSSVLSQVCPGKDVRRLVRVLISRCLPRHQLNGVVAWLPGEIVAGKYVLGTCTGGPPWEMEYGKSQKAAGPSAGRPTIEWERFAGSDRSGTRQRMQDVLRETSHL